MTLNAKGARLGPKLITVASAAALFIAQSSPVLAADYSQLGADQIRMGQSVHGGATAMLSLRLPFGYGVVHENPSAGFQLGLAHSTARSNFNNVKQYYQMKLADFRFDHEGLARARMGSVDLAPMLQPERFNAKDGTGSPDNGILLVLAAVTVGIGVCAIGGCFGGSDSDDADGPNIRCEDDDGFVVPCPF
jgi:hypothetical protein